MNCDKWLDMLTLTVLTVLKIKVCSILYPQENDWGVVGFCTGSWVWFYRACKKDINESSGVSPFFSLSNAVLSPSVEKLHFPTFLTCSLHEQIICQNTLQRIMLTLWSGTSPSSKRVIPEWKIPKLQSPSNIPVKALVLKRSWRGDICVNLEKE